MAIADLPDLQDAIARRFRILEQFGPMDVLPAILPVIQVDPLSVAVSTGPSDAPFRRGDQIFNSTTGVQVANFVRITSGPLAAGLYDVGAHWTGVWTGVTSASQRMELVRTLGGVRNVLHSWMTGPAAVVTDPAETLLFAVQLEDQETIEMRTVVVTFAGDTIRATLWAKVRS